MLQARENGKARASVCFTRKSVLLLDSSRNISSVNAEIQPPSNRLRARPQLVPTTLKGITVTHSWKPACADCNYKWSENSSSSATEGLTMFKEHF